jgi:hypothetical protein
MTSLLITNWITHVHDSLALTWHYITWRGEDNSSLLCLLTLTTLHTTHSLSPITYPAWFCHIRLAVHLRYITSWRNPVLWETTVMLMQQAVKASMDQASMDPGPDTSKDFVVMKPHLTLNLNLFFLYFFHEYWYQIHLPLLSWDHYGITITALTGAWPWCLTLCLYLTSTPYKVTPVTTISWSDFYSHSTVYTSTSIPTPRQTPCSMNTLP